MKKNFTFLKESSLIKTEDVAKILTRFNQIYKENIYQSTNPNAREIIGNDILSEPIFSEVLHKIQKKFESIIGESDLIFQKLWLFSWISNDTDKKILPYVPHFDQHRVLKAMVYLHDVSLDHGPIELGNVKNTFNVDQLRINLSENDKEKGLNIIKKEDLKENLTPMTGTAGDVIFFDTNTPHKAGIIKKGFYRKVLRFTFERHGIINHKPSMINRIINKILN